MMELLNKRCLLNFNLEVLHGCKWNCDGCHVEKEAQDGFIKGDIDKFIKLTSEFKTYYYKPSILLVGPTDIFTASNSIDILSDPKFIELNKSYERITFSSTFLELDNRVIEILNEHYNNMEIEFGVVIESKQFFNDSYLKNIRINLEKMYSTLKCKKIVIHLKFNLHGTEDYKDHKKLLDYINVNKRAYEFFGVNLDYDFGGGRSKDLKKSEVISLIRWLKDSMEHHMTIANKNQDKNMHLDISDMDDIQEHFFVYRNGEFFYPPKMYDDFIIFNDYFKLPIKDWKPKEFIQYEYDLNINQYNNGAGKECENCKYVGNCIDRGILFFMDYYNVKDCLMPKKAYDTMNNDY